jgi:thymidylate synthase (FAD)
MHIVRPYAKIVNFMGLSSETRKNSNLTAHPPISSGTEAVRFIEETGRKCYRSEGGMSDDSYVRFLQSHTLTNYHTSMLRFSCVVVDFMVDRGVAQEITRHGKTLDFQHESQRYCNYAKGKFGSSVGFIRPRGLTEEQDTWWKRSMRQAEEEYFAGLALGLKPQIAADVLPRATASLLTAAGNFQAWRHFLLARTSRQCHPKLLDVTANPAGYENEEELSMSEDAAVVLAPLLDLFKATFPVLFDDIEPLGDYPTNMRKPR